MNKQTIAALHAERKAIESGKIAPGRVWVVTKRSDGTVDRRQVSAKAYQTKQRKEATEQNTALPARRVMGVSQDRFAEMLGISPATVRNIEQGRTKPTGPTSTLLRIAEHHPEVFLPASQKKASASTVSMRPARAVAKTGTALKRSK